MTNITANGIYPLSGSNWSTILRTFAYEGNLGGGSLRLFSVIGETRSPVPASILTAAELDRDGNPIQQVVFQTAGRIELEVSGAAGPNFTAAIK